MKQTLSIQEIIDENYSTNQRIDRFFELLAQLVVEANNIED